MKRKLHTKHFENKVIVFQLHTEASPNLTFLGGIAFWSFV